MADKPKAVVLLSGGMDSCVTARHCQPNRTASRCCMPVMARGRNAASGAHLRKSRILRSAERLHIRRRFDSSRQIGGSALTDERIACPAAGEASRRRGRHSGDLCPVSQRPLLAAAVSWAEVIGARRF